MNLFNTTNSFTEDESEMFDDTNFNLNDRQKHVVEWMVTREKLEPYGGIIESNMGSIGDKFTVIMSLMAKSRDISAVNTQSEGETDLDEDNIHVGHTLIVCTKKKINHWIEWIQNNLPPNILNVCLHYGRRREMSIQKLSQNDIVVTAVTLVLQSFIHQKNDPLHKIKWGRIILDDALCVRDHKLKTSKALCQLLGTYRWAFIQPECINDNDTNTYYSLMKFINYKPFNNIKKWDKWLKTNPSIAVKEKFEHIHYKKKII